MAIPDYKLLVLQTIKKIGFCLNSRFVHGENTVKFTIML